MDIQKILEECDDGTIKLDDLDNCVVGITIRDELIYSYELMLQKFMGEGMDFEEATEWLSYNVVPICTGGGKYPIIFYDNPYLHEYEWLKEKEKFEIIAFST